MRIETLKDAHEEEMQMEEYRKMVQKGYITLEEANKTLINLGFKAI